MIHQSHQWSFLILLIGGKIAAYNHPIGSKKATYIPFTYCLLGGLYTTYLKVKIDGLPIPKGRLVISKGSENKAICRDCDCAIYFSILTHKYPLYRARNRDFS